MRSRACSEVFLINAHRLGRPMLAALLAGILGSASSAGSDQHADQTTRVLSAEINKGKLIFMRQGCYTCHGVQAHGALATGPALTPEVMGLVPFKIYVRAPRGFMPPFSARVLAESDLDAIYAYVASIPKDRSPRDIAALIPYLPPDP
ncbi:MAG TPA: cytochrome c [Steroidobacteraceae bacterium]